MVHHERGVKDAESNGGDAGTNFELDDCPKVDPLTRSEKLIGLRYSLEIVRNILKCPPAMETALML